MKTPGKSESQPNTPHLSEMEWEVMKPFWEHGPMAARDVFQHIPEEHHWAYKTVKSMLGRLVKKGVLTYQQVGNSYLYKAAYTREELTGAATLSFVQRVFNGALRPFLATFAESIPPEELKALRVELTRIERENAQKDKGK